MYRDLGLRFDGAVAALDMITFLGPDEPVALAAATEAREFFAELDAPVYVTRFDRLIAAPTPQEGVARISPMLQTAR
jgi:hypothetical protein